MRVTLILLAMLPVLVLGCGGSKKAASSAATPSASPGAAACAVYTAAPSQPPGPGADVTILGQFVCGSTPVVGSNMTATWHFKSGDVTCTGQSSGTGTASCMRNIGTPPSGVPVNVDVCFDRNGIPFCGTASFTPQ